MMGWDAEYRYRFQGMRIRYFQDEMYLFDLNADGTPELFTHGGGQIDYNKIFTFKNGKVEMVHWGTSFSLLDNGIVYVQFSSGMGYNL